MAKKPEPPPPPPDVPIEMLRKIFADNVKRRMWAKGWNQSELARQAARYMPKKRLIRDNVSKWLREKVLPDSLHLRALAKALGCAPEELLPARPSGSKEHPAFSMQTTGDGNVWLRVNQAVPLSVASKIAALLDNEK